MGREPGSKIVDGKVVPPDRDMVGSVPVESSPMADLPELPELGTSRKQEKRHEPFIDGRLTVEPVHNGIMVKVSPATFLNANMKPDALLQGFNKQNQWITLNEVSPQGGKRLIRPPKESNPSQEFTAVRLMEGTCQVKFGGNDDGDS